MRGCKERGRGVALLTCCLIFLTFWNRGQEILWPIQLMLAFWKLLAAECDGNLSVQSELWDSSLSHGSLSFTIARLLCLRLI